MDALKRSNFGVLAVIVLAFLLIGTSFTRAETAGSAKSPPIVDKTLVAWVYLANTTQRGGSVLTMIDNSERFDAIVFGENTAGRWMAGSDSGRRTQADQSSYATETADEKTFVQIAVTYSGKNVTIYRNGKHYAGYSIAKPQPFDADATVLLGLRYIGKMGDIGYFTGAIEEARIYDCALKLETITALQLNKPSAPKPIGQWTFEDGTASDSSGNYYDGHLRGDARIADGRLHLDGKYSFVQIHRPIEAEVQSMFYKARSPQTGNMWDTWVYFHEGTYYLYYLGCVGEIWDNVSMASSPDGVHWKEIGPVYLKHPKAYAIGSGATWKSPNFAKDGKFFMHFGQSFPGEQVKGFIDINTRMKNGFFPKTVRFCESTDLIHWKLLDRTKYGFIPDTRWYPWGADCINATARPDGGFYGYWSCGSGPGFGQSLDGIKWEALPPIKAEGFEKCEVGDVEKIGDKFYMMLGHNFMMYTMTADQPQGPFMRAKKNFHLMSNRNTYFTRFVRTPDGLLVNHHSWSSQRASTWGRREFYFAPLKSAVVDDEGTLRLGWWKGNEKMKHELVEVQLPGCTPGTETPVVMLGNTFDTQVGVILEGTLELPEAGEPRRGLYIEYGPDSGSAVLIDARGAAELGKIKSDGSGFRIEKRVNREMQFGKPAAFRLLLKHSMLEFYLDDILIECYMLPHNATGRIGMICGSNSQAIAKLKAWY